MKSVIKRVHREKKETIIEIAMTIIRSVCKAQQLTVVIR